MKGKRNRVYWLALAVAVAVSALYAQRSDLVERFRAHHVRQQELDAARIEVRRLEEELDRTSQRVDGLHEDNLEIEAAIRKTMHRVRAGEKVFRVTPLPEKPPVPEPDFPGTGKRKAGRETEPRNTPEEPG